MVGKGASSKTIKEHIARAKTYVQKGDVRRSLANLVKALELFITSKIFGREKFEIEILLDEVLRELSRQPALKRLFPDGLTYIRGQERKLYQTTKKLHDKLVQVMEKMRIERIRKQKYTIDEMLIAGQEHLKNGEPMEARKAFRKCSETFGGDEPGLFSDIGNRLLMAGMFQEAIEYFERGREAMSGDARPYTGLINCYEGLGETGKAMEMVKETMRKFGANESLYTKLAKQFLAKREWGEAHDAAQAALNLNPLSAEAKKIVDRTASKIFTGGRRSAKPGAKPGASGKKGGGKAIKLDI